METSDCITFPPEDNFLTKAGFYQAVWQSHQVKETELKVEDG